MKNLSHPEETLLITRPNGDPVPVVDYKNSNVINTYWMPIEEFLQLDEVFCQRDTEARLKKARKYLDTCIPEHVNVAVAKLTKNGSLNGKTYKAGTLFRVDSNTRAMNWSEGNSDHIPKEVHVTEYSFDNLDRIRESYNTFDSADATEKNQEKLVGIIQGIYRYEPKSQKLKKGQVLTGLKFAGAFYYPEYYDIKDIYSPQPNELTGFLGSLHVELFHLDNYMSKPTWTQAHVCAALMGIKRYGTANEKLNKFLEGLNEREQDTRSVHKKRYDGLTHINKEFDNPTWTKNLGTRLPEMQELVSFILYFMNAYMDDRRLIKRDESWKTFWSKWKEFPTHQDLFSQNLNVVSHPFDKAA
jgi:hypothetical protein